MTTLKLNAIIEEAQERNKYVQELLHGKTTETHSPLYLFSDTSTVLLKQIVDGRVNVKELAKNELLERSLKGDI